MVTKKAHYQHKSNADKTKFVDMEINSFVIYLNHITFSIAVRQQAKAPSRNKVFQSQQKCKEHKYLCNITCFWH